MHYKRSQLSTVRHGYGYIVDELIEDLQDAYGEIDELEKEVKGLEKKVRELEAKIK